MAGVPPPPHLDRALNRFAELAQDDAAPPQRLRLETGVASRVGSTTDGNIAVSVTVGADLIPAPYCDTAPADGALVVVVFVNGSPIIFGTLKGFPLF